MKGRRQEYAAAEASGMQGSAEREAGQAKWWRAADSGSSSVTAYRPVCRPLPGFGWQQGC